MLRRSSSRGGEGPVPVAVEGFLSKVSLCILSMPADACLQRTARGEYSMLPFQSQAAGWGVWPEVDRCRSKGTGVYEVTLKTPYWGNTDWSVKTRKPGCGWKGVLGCALGHMRVREAMARRGWVHVVEDDTFLKVTPRHFTQVYNNLLTGADIHCVYPAALPCSFATALWGGDGGRRAGADWSRGLGF